MECLICFVFVRGNQGLSKHVRKHHDMLPEEYIIQHKYNGVHPTCQCGCGTLTKFRKGGIFDFATVVRGHKTLETKERIEKKRRQTCLDRYGTDCTLQSEETKKKTVATNLARHGLPHYSQTSECKEKMKATTLSRYGTEWYTQSQEYKSQLVKKNRLAWDEILNHCHNKGYEPQFTYEEYVTNRTVLKFKCEKHNTLFSSNICNVQRMTGTQCPYCKTQGISMMETSLADEVASLIEIERNTKKIIPPQELDIFIPSKNIAIEFNGLYWHSEHHKDRSYHLKKYKRCKSRDIQLFQIYEDEWRDKREIWESILSAKLNITDKFKKLNARDMEFVLDPPVKKIRKFLDENHLQGYARCKKKFTLVNKEDEIVFCITLREPFTKQKEGVIEVARVCSKRFSLVRGGFTKLMKRATLWASLSGYKEILTYSDCRYSEGKTYENNHFNYVGHTGVGYDYTDGFDRYPRFNFRAQEGKTEKEVAEQNEVYRIYNAGNQIWKMEL